MSLVQTMQIPVIIDDTHVHCKRSLNSQEKAQLIKAVLKQPCDRKVINLMRELGNYQQILMLTNHKDWAEVIHQFDYPISLAALDQYDSKNRMFNDNPFISFNTHSTLFMAHIETYGTSFQRFDDILPAILDIISIQKHYGSLSMIFKGFTMVFCSAYLDQLFLNNSINSILRKYGSPKKYKQIRQFPGGNKSQWLVDFTMRIKEWKKQTKKDFATKGMELINTNFDDLKEYIGHTDCNDPAVCNTFGGNYVWLIKGYIDHYITKNYEKAKIWYLYSAFSSTDMYIKIISLIRLCYICAQKSEQYITGLKALKIAFELSCQASIMPKFVSNRYFKRKRIIQKKRRKIKCFNCGNKWNKSFMLCKGCMVAVYCNKRCQKRHWKLNHRNECNRLYQHYNHIYGNLQLMRNSFIR